MSVTATILAAAEAAGEHAAEHDETAFFVAGAVWAAFAIAISIYGFRKPDFPGSSGAARGVMAASILLAVGAMFTAVYVAL